VRHDFELPPDWAIEIFSPEQKANKVDDCLSFALIQQLVYTNIRIKDQYLPSVQALLSGETSPIEASRAIESPETHFRSKIQAAIQA
jgi:Uma2 family endonuclease